MRYKQLSVVTPDGRTYILFELLGRPILTYGAVQKIERTLSTNMHISENSRNPNVEELHMGKMEMRTMDGIVDIYNYAFFIFLICFSPFFCTEILLMIVKP